MIPAAPLAALTTTATTTARCCPFSCLAGFERADPHRACVLHRQRVRLLAPLEGQLSPEHYPGLSRSISLELGNVSREVADIKAAAGREQSKVLRLLHVCQLKSADPC